MSDPRDGSRGGAPDADVEARPVAGGQSGAFARRAFAPGERIGLFEGARVAAPSRLSLQIGPGLHVDPDPGCVLRLLNHSCAPNAAFEGTTLFAARAVAAGDELVIDYTCHEADMESPFDCACGAAECVGRVAGWTRLTAAQRAARRDRVASWLTAG